MVIQYFSFFLAAVISLVASAEPDYSLRVRALYKTKQSAPAAPNHAKHELWDFWAVSFILAPTKKAKKVSPAWLQISCVGTYQ